MTNLETTFLRREPPPDSRGDSAPMWPFGAADIASLLPRLGVNVVSLANNHTADYGEIGISDTREILDGLRVQHAGAGDSLEEARAPVFVGRTPRRVAVIAVSTSSTAEARATSVRGEIRGRPGVNPLRYSADVTVDAATFETLKSTVAAMPSDQPAGDPHTVNLFGTRIRRGDRTVVSFTPDARDVAQILEAVRRARRESDAVVLSLHSHEPSNTSDAPAEFVQRFARAAIDAGAVLVVGHGPHRIRGVEAYGGGAILYSVGNFLFQYQHVDRQAADVYDAGVDLYRLALGAVDFSVPRVLPPFDEPVWWEGIVGIATVEHGRLTALRLQPIDLGIDVPPADRGVPRIAAPERARQIIERVSRLSRELGTHVSSVDAVATVELPAAGR